MLKLFFRKDTSTRCKNVSPSVDQQYGTLMKKVLVDQVKFLNQCHSYITSSDIKSHNCQILALPASFLRNLMIIYNRHYDFYLDLKIFLENSDEKYSFGHAIEKLVSGFPGLDLSVAYRQYFDDLRKLSETKLVRVQLIKSVSHYEYFCKYLDFLDSPRLMLSELEQNLNVAVNILKTGHADLDIVIFARDFVVLAGIEALDPRDMLLMRGKKSKHTPASVELYTSLKHFGELTMVYTKTINGPLEAGRIRPIGQMIQGAMAYSLVLSHSLKYGRGPLLELVCNNYKFEGALKKGFDAFPIMARKMATFGQNLEKRFSTWNPEIIVGDLILEFFRDFGYRIAYFRYAEHAKEVTSFFSSNLHEKTFFRSFNRHFRKKMAKKIAKVNLMDCYLGPIKFWVRMVNLLQMIHASTPETHPDFQDLNKALIIATVVHSLVKDKIGPENQLPTPTTSKNKKINMLIKFCC